MASRGPGRRQRLVADPRRRAVTRGGQSRAVTMIVGRAATRRRCPEPPPQVDLQVRDGDGPWHRPESAAIQLAGWGSPTSSRRRKEPRRAPHRADRAGCGQPDVISQTRSSLAARPRPSSGGSAPSRVRKKRITSNGFPSAGTFASSSLLGRPEQGPAAAIAGLFLVEAPGGVEGDPGAAPDGDRHRGWPGVAAARDRPASSSARSWPTGRRSAPRGGSPRSARGELRPPRVAASTHSVAPGGDGRGSALYFGNPARPRKSSLGPTRGLYSWSARAGDPAYGPLASTRAVNPLQPRSCLVLGNFAKRWGPRAGRAAGHPALSACSEPRPVRPAGGKPSEHKTHAAICPRCRRASRSPDHVRRSRPGTLTSRSRPDPLAERLARASRPGGRWVCVRPGPDLDGVPGRLREVPPSPAASDYSAPSAPSSSSTKVTSSSTRGEGVIRFLSSSTSSSGRISRSFGVDSTRAWQA